MRKLILPLAVAVASTFVLSACDKAADTTAQTAAAVVETVPLPTDATDTAAWKKYLANVVTNNMQGVTTTRPYMYYIPGGEDDKALDDRSNQLENVRGVVGRGVLPGNMMAFGGPDSKITADFVIEAFQSAQSGSFKDVVVLVIGTPEDTTRVKEALTPSGANVRAAELK